MPHKNTEFYQSLNIIKTDESTAYSEDGKSNHTSIENSDLSADMVQAMARICIRNITTLDGGCLPATAYITLNPKKDLHNTLSDSLRQQFPEANISEWYLPEVIAKAEKLPIGFNATLDYLDDRLTAVGMDIHIYEPRDTLDVKRDSYTRLLKDTTFLEQIKHLGVQIQERKVVDKRGRMKKRPDKFFVRINEKVNEYGD